MDSNHRSSDPESDVLVTKLQDNLLVVVPSGFEPETSASKGPRSTTELRNNIKNPTHLVCTGEERAITCEFVESLGVEPQIYGFSDHRIDHLC